MKKALKIIIKSVSALIIFLIMLPIAIGLILQISFVQKWAVDTTTEILSEVTGTKFSVGSINLEFFTIAKLGDVYIEDYAGDTMIYVRELEAKINGINFLSGKISLGTVTLNNGEVNLRSDSTGAMNIDRIFANFIPEVPNPNPPNFRLTATELNIIDTDFSMMKYGATLSKTSRIDFENLHFNDIQFQARDISVNNHNIWMSMEHISLHEPSGFAIDHFSSERCGVDSSGMYLQAVALESGNTTLHLDSLNLLTRNEKWTDWKDFENNIIFAANVKNSRLSSKALHSITGIEMQNPQDITIEELEVNGALSSLKGSVQNVQFCDNSLWAKFTIMGLPDIDRTRFDFDLQRLHSNQSAISNVLLAVANSSLEPSALRLVERLGDIELSARINGGTKGFESSLRVNTSNVGLVEASCDMSLKNGNEMIFGGKVTANNLFLSELFGDQNAGEMSLYGGYVIDLVENEPLVLDADFNIASFRYADYTYRDIQLDGEFESMRFNGVVNSSDPNFDVDVFGAFDFSELTPNYNISTTLNKVNLHAIGLNPRDSISLLSAQFVARGSGTTLDDFNGEGIIDSIYYINHLDTVSTGAIEIASIAEPQLKELKINSRFMDINLRGRNSFSEIFAYFANSMSSYIPSFPEVSQIVGQEEWSEGATKAGSTSTATSFPYSDGYYLLSVEVKEANNVSSAFIPSLEISRGSSLNFFFNPYLNQFNLRVNSEYIISDDFLVNQLSLDARNIEDSLSVYSTASTVAVGSMYFPNFSLLGGVRSNSMTLGVQFNNLQNGNSALVNTTTTFQRREDGNTQLNVDIHPTAIAFDSIKWIISPSQVVLDTSAVRINNFRAHNGNKYISINGTIGKNPSDTLKANFDGINLAPLSVFVESLGYELKGTTSGRAEVIALTGKSYLAADVDFEDVELSGTKIGDARLSSELSAGGDFINFTLGRNGSPYQPITGFYDIVDNYLESDIAFDSIPLRLLDPILEGIIGASTGKASTMLSLTVGETEGLNLDGFIDFENYSTMVDFTRTRYTIPQGRVRVEKNSFYMDKIALKDAEQGTGDISMALRSQEFQNMTYNIDVNFTDLLALNTTVKDNDSFFGKAYGTGRLSVTGNDRKVDLDIVAATALNSQITMPMSGASNIEETEFITFVEPRRIDSAKFENVLRRYRRNTVARKKKVESSAILEMNITIDVLPNTLAQIELDAKVGDIIKGRGQGLLSMRIMPDYDLFTMHGPVEITSGNYLFTMQTIINKRFIIEPGSSILWTGDPTNPDVNLTALYKLKTSISPLTGDVQNTQANIDCGINLTGKMLQPDINFSVTAPSADAEIQNALRNTLNTEEALSMQFLSLMLANSFMPDMGTASIGTIGSSLAGVTSMEFLSNQLSNLISSENLDIRIGYKPQSTTTSDEFTAGVGTDLIQDVLSFEVDGNYNMGNNSAAINNNPFSVDANLTWNINKSGTLRLKGFTRTIDRFDETQGMQESGVGIYFKQDFNDFEDLIRRLRKNFTQDTLELQRLEEERLQRAAEREEQRALRKAEIEKMREEREKERAAKRRNDDDDDDDDEGQQSQGNNLRITEQTEEQTEETDTEKQSDTKS